MSIKERVSDYAEGFSVSKAWVDVLIFHILSAGYIVYLVFCVKKNISVSTAIESWSMATPLLLVWAFTFQLILEYIMAFFKRAKLTNETERELIRLKRLEGRIRSMLAQRKADTISELEAKGYVFDDKDKDVDNTRKEPPIPPKED